jgi:hypothetical protein
MVENDKAQERLKRRRRLAQALKANLGRRKTQQRKQADRPAQKSSARENEPHA